MVKKRKMVEMAEMECEREQDIVLECAINHIFLEQNMNSKKEKKNKNRMKYRKYCWIFRSSWVWKESKNYWKELLVDRTYTHWMAKIKAVFVAIKQKYYLLNLIFTHGSAMQYSN